MIRSRVILLHPTLGRALESTFPATEHPCADSARGGGGGVVGRVRPKTVASHGELVLGELFLRRCGQRCFLGQSFSLGTRRLAQPCLPRPNQQ
jgi:hypothetical protein